MPANVAELMGISVGSLLNLRITESFTNIHKTLK
jgi:hypothetical protein